MRTKISAIRIGREMLEADFAQTLQLPDDVKDKARVTAYMPNLGLKMDVDEDEDGEVEDLVEGSGVLGAVVGTRGNPWRRRKSRGIKKRNRKGLRMGFGKAGSGIDGQNLGAGAASKGKGKGDARDDGLSPGAEELLAQEPVVGSVEGENAVLGRGGDIRDPLEAIGIDNLDVTAENEEGDEGFRGEREDDEVGQGGANDDDDDDRDGQDEDEDKDDIGDEDDLGDDDDDDDEDGNDDDDDELDGEGW